MLHDLPFSNDLHRYMMLVDLLISGHYVAYILNLRKDQFLGDWAAMNWHCMELSLVNRIKRGE